MNLIWPLAGTALAGGHRKSGARHADGGGRGRGAGEERASSGVGRRIAGAALHVVSFAGDHGTLRFNPPALTQAGAAALDVIQYGDNIGRRLPAAMRRTIFLPTRIAPT
jgi:hypothetical protein